MVDPGEVVEAIRRAILEQDGPVALHEPRFQGNEWKYVKQCLDTGWVSSAGAFVSRFEEELARFVGVERAVAVVNGTAALHASLRLVGVDAGEEVLVPSLTFVATANAVAYLGAIPHFIDVDPDTLGMDANRLADYLGDVTERTDQGCRNRHTGSHIRVMVPMHTFGHPCDLDGLSAVCERFGLAMVEDAAEALGSYYRDRHVGTFGTFGVLSFNGNKVITTGGGGAILTNDGELADQMKHLTSTAKRSHRWEFFHDEIGYNYRLPNLNAAVGVGQLERLPGFLRRKRNLANAYRSSFSGVAGVRFVEEPALGRSNYWLNAIVIDEAGDRTAILEAAHEAKLLLRPPWQPMHVLPPYRDCPRMDLAVTDEYARRLINLPSSPFLAPES